MEKTTKTHYLRHDHRHVSLEMTIKGLSDSIAELHNQMNVVYWCDGDWFLEESEPIYGLALISFQNYINGSIKDFTGSLKERSKYYKLEQNSIHINRSRIELIIGLANYAKHKDEGLPHKGTKDILDFFKLNYLNVAYLDRSPIFEGLSLLEENWNLFEIKNLVTEWREFIWSRNE
jgi:hypothetical protein